MLGASTFHKVFSFFGLVGAQLERLAGRVVCHV